MEYHQNTPDTFSNLRFDDLKIYADRWVKSFSKYTIESISLYRYSSMYAERDPGVMKSIDEIVNLNIKYVVVFEFADISDQNFEEFQQYWNYMTQKDYENSKHFFRLIDSGFLQYVYKKPFDEKKPSDENSFTGDWWFEHKIPGETLPGFVMEHEPYWLLFPEVDIAADDLNGEKHGEEFPLIDNQHNYIFRKEGQYWTLMFEGMEHPIHVKHQKGLLYIQFLLKNFEKSFEVIELVHSVEGTPIESVSINEKNIDEDEINHSISLGKHINPKKIKQRLYRIDIEIDSADREGNELLKKELLVKREDLLESLEKYLNPEIEKQKKYVNKYINRALKAIKKESKVDLSLYNHLKTHLTPAKFPISYRPDQIIPWQI